MDKLKTKLLSISDASKLDLFNCLFDLGKASDTTTGELIDNGIRIDSFIFEIKPIDNGFSYTFEEFWNDYDKKIGVHKCKALFSKLKQSDLKGIKATIKAYILDTPDKTYRKNAQTYLNQKVWIDYLQKISLKNPTPKTNITYDEFR